MNSTGENLKSINNNIKGEYDSAGIVGWIRNGKLINSYSKSKIEGFQITGGAVGLLHQKGEKTILSNIISYSDVSCLDEWCGGVVGAFAGGYSAENLISYANINGVKLVGGISGGTDDNDYGYATEIKNCKSYANINVTGDIAGGLLGYLDNEISDCFDYSTITSVANATQIGGLVGYVKDAEITNCTASTIINGEKVTLDTILGIQSGTNTIINPLID